MKNGTAEAKNMINVEVTYSMMIRIYMIGSFNFHSIPFINLHSLHYRHYPFLRRVGNPIHNPHMCAHLSILPTTTKLRRAVWAYFLFEWI